MARERSARVSLAVGLVAYLAVGLAAAGPSVALAAAPAADENTAKAKAAFERGREHYAKGEYEAAAQDFERGYTLAKRPAFLVNLGQSYRQLGQLEKARDYYKLFLEQAPPRDPQRPGVQRIVADLDREIAEHPAPSVAAPPPAPTTAPTIAATPTVQLTQPAPPPPKKKPFIKRHWWIIPVGAVALTGIALGIYFGVKARSPELDCSGASLGCLQ